MREYKEREKIEIYREKRRVIERKQGKEEGQSEIQKKRKEKGNNGNEKSSEGKTSGLRKRGKSIKMKEKKASDRKKQEEIERIHFICFFSPFYLSLFFIS